MKTRKNKTVTTLLVSLMLLAFTATTAAQTMTFTYQGQLQNHGEPFTGTVDLEFELLGGPDGDISIGVDAHPDHPVSNGLFQALLSFDTAGTASARGIPEVEILPMYLGITVDGQAVTPPQPVTPAPTAFVSAYAAYAFSAGAPWSIAGDDIQYMSGRVGVGRAPSDHFVIDSGLEQQDDDYGFGTGALRVMVRESGGSGGLTKFRVLGNGGVAIGNSYNSSGVPVDGLRVQGDTRLGSQLRVEGVAQFNDQLQAQDTAFFHGGTVAANFVNGGVIIQHLEGSGATELCRNNQNFISQCSSSARYKEDVADLDDAGDLIRKLRAVTFRWTDSGKDDIGLIAEEVAEIEPRLATYNDEGTVEGVNYRHLTAVVVAALQEQQAENADELAARDAEIAALRDELEAQRRDTAERLAALEALLTEGRQLAGGRQ